DLIFKPRGQRSLNEAIRGFEDARRRIRDQAKHAEGFRAQEDELAQVRQRSVELQQRRQTLLEEQSRLQRALRVLPALAKRRELRARLDQLGAVPALPTDAESERHRAQTALANSEAAAARLRERIAVLEQRRADLLVVDSLLALGPKVMETIPLRLGSHLKAAEDSRSQRARMRALSEEALAVLRSLGRQESLDAVEALRIDAPTRTRIDKLGRDQSGLLERARSAQRDLDVARDALEQARAEIAALPALPNAIKPASDGPALPAAATVGLFAQSYERIERARGTHEERSERLHEREQRLRVDLDTMRRADPPPTEAELAQVRAERDGLWRRVRASASARTRTSSELLDQLEARQQQSDEAADRLRREAERVSALARLLSEQDELSRERDRLRARALELDAEAQALAAEWQETWRPLGVQPRSPQEMQPVLVRLSGFIEAGNRGRAEALRRQQETQRALERWRAQWGELMTRLRLAPDANVEEAEAVLDALLRLFEKVDDMRECKARIDGMDRDAAQFERDVRALVERHLPELRELPLELAAEELTRRYQKARADLEQRAQIDADLQADVERLREGMQQSADAERSLAQLMHAAHVDDLDALQRAEAHATEARELEQRLREVENDLLLQGEGADIDALIAQTADLGSDRIRAQLEDIKDELASVDDEHAASRQQGWSLEAGLEVLKRNDLAAEAASDAEQQLSRIKGQAHSYVCKRLAAEILRSEVRRYRDTHRGPLVSRAAELFARLTLGRYPALGVDYDERDDPALVCIDDHGRRVAVEALSDGARDQLYLALRVASLERFADQAELMPLLLDDVLIHFDDDRARAALQVLGELSAVTQVLFFTHHARIVELAREAIPASTRHEHRLVEDRAPAAMARPG
ncbi:MAG: hypothetical protein ACHQ53_05775, partial [Polyangiales bacterium]